ncbi:MAG TPA: hypothetical protein EYG78_05590 [Sulfurovum sp.]|nr:hypothetical protein [Sulfurovum sp.]
MLSTIKHKLISLLQLILVLIYILFEEIIWEGISKPIYEFVHSLKILQRVEYLLHAVNAYVILVIFVLMLGLVEALGIYAGLLFVSGKMWHGLSLYLTKIPIAAFTFWMFRITEDKLMTFGWFKWLYGKVMAVIDWLKSLDIYIATMEKLGVYKRKIKAFKIDIKEKYFSKESPFVSKIKRLYKVMKESLGKK